jgi:3-methyladenine DNA glycosylase AlkD
VPTLKLVAKKYKDLSFTDIETLFASKIHDHRYLALNIIKINYEKEKNKERKKELFELSLKNISAINNWDLVDSFIPYIW